VRIASLQQQCSDANQNINGGLQSRNENIMQVLLFLMCIALFCFIRHGPKIILCPFVNVERATKDMIALKLCDDWVLLGFMLFNNTARVNKYNIWLYVMSVFLLGNNVNCG